MDPNVFTSAGLLLMLANLTAGQLASATVHLFINDVDPGKGAVVGDFTEATFTGSAALTVTAWGEAFLNLQLDAESIANLMQWDWDAGSAETVFGVYVLSAAMGTPLLGYARLTTPKDMGATTDSIALVLKMVLGPNGLGTGVRLDV